MKNVTVTRKIVFGFVVLVVLMALSGLFSVYTLFDATGQLRDQRDRQQQQAANKQLETAANELKIDVVSQVDALRAELLARSQGGGTLTDISQNQQATRADLDQLKELVSYDAARQKLDVVGKNVAAFDRMTSQVLALARAGQVAEATALAEQEANPQAEILIRSVDDLLGALDEYYAAAAKDAEAEQQRLDDLVKTRGTMAAAAVAIAIAIAILLAVFLPRQVSRQLSGAIASLGTSTAEMLAVTSQVAAGAVQTATAISEAATTVDEVRQTSLLASQKATAVSDNAQAADQVAEAGRRAVAETLDGIRRIQEQMQVVADSVVRLSEQTEAVSEIIATSSDIAEQSNLLSVNAAIEAAKASEQGKGFSVVAEEIKSLAAQSKQGVTQVRSILSEIQHATSAAVMAAEQSHRAIEEGASQALESSQAIESLAENVAAAAQSAMQIVASAQQQLVGMDQISEAMASIDQASAQNASGARQLEAEVHHLRGLADSLQQMIDAHARIDPDAIEGGLDGPLPEPVDE